MNSNTLYKQEIIDHYKNPRNFTDEKEVSTMQYSNKTANISCGDELILGVTIEKDIIKDVKINGRGCAISMAAASMLSEKIKGKSLKEIKKIDADSVLALTNMSKTSARVKCGLLAYEALKQILKMVE